jgi:uncharacterized protein YegP (UPF0339 family)
MAGKFEIKKTKNGQFMFNLVAPNGQIILTSQSYKAKSSAKAGIAAVQKNAARDASFERKVSSSNSPYFVLNAANRKIIGKSENYGNAGAMENGVASVKANAAGARIEDLTLTGRGMRSRKK